MVELRGEAEAERAWDDAAEEMLVLSEKVAATRALTIEGLIFTARFTNWTKTSPARAASRCRSSATSLLDLFSSDNEFDAYQAQRDGYRQGQRGAEKFIGRGSGIDPYKPDNQYIKELAQRGGGYLDSYSDALGLNGQQGSDAAALRFQAGPGYAGTMQAPAALEEWSDLG